MNKFAAAFHQTETDKGYVHDYDKWYNTIFKDYTPKSLLEIGVMSGRSLAAWKIVFPNCDITGLDITNKKISAKYIKMADAKIVIGNSTKPEIKDIVTESYDVIIDDGSHYYKDIIATWENFNDKFNYAYVIEDVMFEKESILNSIKERGYTNIKIYPSSRQGVTVNASFLQNGVYDDKGAAITINLYMIVVYKN